MIFTLCVAVSAILGYYIGTLDRWSRSLDERIKALDDVISSRETAPNIDHFHDHLTQDPEATEAMVHRIVDLEAWAPRVPKA